MGVVAGSASVNGRVVTVSVTNAHARIPVEVALDVRGASVDGVTAAAALGGDDLHAHNTFDEPERVTPQRRAGGVVSAERITLAPASVGVFQLALS
jgi:alpha-N-arabinofuranosidase